MQVPSEYPPSAALLAYSALSIVLLLSLAIAIFEAASALRRKFGAGAATGAEDGGGRATDGPSGAGTALEKTAPGARLGRTKKMSLPEFTWMRHLRRCSRTNPHASADRERRFSHRMSLVHAHVRLRNQCTLFSPRFRRSMHSFVFVYLTLAIVLTDLHLS